MIVATASIRWAALLILTMGSWVGPVHGEEGRDLRAASIEDLARIMRTERPTPALTNALTTSRHRILFEHALRGAVRDANGTELLNAVEHLVQLGMLSGGVWSSLSFLVDTEVALEGTLRKLYHPDLHVYTFEMDVRRVLAGGIRLTPDNSPLRVLVSVAGSEHTRWIRIHRNPWDEGTVVTVFAERGEALFERSGLLVRGWTAWGGHVWKSTGREEATLALLTPLSLRDPEALLDGMRAEDRDHRWLSTVRTVMTCHSLGEPFNRWWSGGEYDRGLDRERLGPVHLEVIKALESVAGSIQWNDVRERFERVEDK